MLHNSKQQELYLLLNLSESCHQWLEKYVKRLVVVFTIMVNSVFFHMPAKDILRTKWENCYKFKECKIMLKSCKKV